MGVYQIKRYSEDAEQPRISWSVKLALFLANVVLQSANGLLLASIKADNNDDLPFSGLMVVFLVEVLKLLLSAGMHFGGGGSVQCVDFLFAVPGAVYMIVDNLYFVMVSYISPATVQLLWNMKVVWTALLMYCVMKTRVQCMQWLAIAMLVAALVLSKFDKAAETTDEAALDGTPLTLRQLHDADVKRGNFMMGLMFCVFGSILVSGGNVGCEWLMKRSPQQSVHWQNMQLYLFGIVFSMMVLFMRLHRDSSEESSWTLMFKGFEGRTLLVILIQACSGIIIGAMLKFTDNMMVIFSHVCAMFTVSIGSSLFFGFVMRWNFVAGLLLASASLWGYFHFKPIEVHEDAIDGPVGGSGVAFFTVADELDEAFGDAMGNEYGEDAPFL